MNVPDVKTFRALSEKGSWIALTASISADLDTPVSAFLTWCGKNPEAFLFESVEQGDRIGRYSLLGTHPRQIIRYDGDRTYISERPFREKPTVYIGDPVSYMQFTMRKFSLANPPAVRGFHGGYVGFLGYEVVQEFESVRLRAKEKNDAPRSVFYFIDEYLVFDHLNHSLSAVVLVPSSDVTERAYRAGRKRLDQLIKKMTATMRAEPKPLTTGKKKPSLRISANMSRAAFIKKVKRIKQYITAGDAIQVVLSQRFNLGRTSTPFDIYRSLRSLNPSPYMFYFRDGDLHLVGSSPEVMVKKEGSQVELRPIAGTRPRGETEDADAAFERELKNSTKEHAEHLMLVDLGRNDIGRVCDFKTVRVKEYARIERYSHVMHLVSDVVGKLRKDCDMFDLLRATFPAGTVSGAPKIRAMEIIDELEPTERGPYAGSVGYLSLSGDMDMCITIRTVVVRKGNATVQAGAGIVYDSDPDAEYQETLNKAKALFRAVEKASA